MFSFPERGKNSQVTSVFSYGICFLEYVDVLLKDCFLCVCLLLSYTKL